MVNTVKEFNQKVSIDSIIISRINDLSPDDVPSLDLTDMEGWIIRITDQASLRYIDIELTEMQTVGGDTLGSKNINTSYVIYQAEASGVGNLNSTDLFKPSVEAQIEVPQNSFIGTCLINYEINGMTDFRIDVEVKELEEVPV